MNSWKGRWLSWAGRLVMLKTLVSSLPIYLLSYLALTSGANTNIIHKMRRFFWQGLAEKDRVALISWEKICKPKEYGGVSLRDQSSKNKALGAKLVWKMLNEPKIKWARILQTKYLNTNDPAEIFKNVNPPKGSWVWNFMLSCRYVIANHVSWDIYGGETTLF